MPTYDCVDFDGTDDYINCGSAATLDNIWDDGGSIAMWVRTDNEQVSHANVSKGSYAALTGWIFGVDNTGAGQSATVPLRMGFSTTAGVWATSQGHIPVSTWVHVVITYDSSSTANDPIIYVNGSSVSMTEATAPVGTRSDDSASNMWIGRDGAAAYSYHDGQFDDIRVFNAILTPEQVTTLAGTHPYPSAIGGEVLWLTMANTTAGWDGATLDATKLITDLSGNANTGTPSGNPLGAASSCPRFASWLWSCRAFAGVMYQQVVAGVLTFVGTFGPTRTHKNVAGAQTFIGTVKKAIYLTHGFTGAMTFVGTVVKKTKKPLSGAITFTGSLVKKTKKALSGVIQFVGGLSRRRMTPTTIYMNVAPTVGVPFDGAPSDDVILDVDPIYGVPFDKI